MVLRLTQVEGVQWLFRLHTLQSGGILGDLLPTLCTSVSLAAPVVGAAVMTACINEFDLKSYVSF